MLRVGSEYDAALQRIVSGLKKSVQDEILPILKEEKKEYTADAWGDRVQSALDTLLKRWASDQFYRIAKGLAENFVSSTLKFADRKQSKTVGINVFQNSKQLDDYLGAAVIQNINLIKSIPQKHIENVGNIVFSGMRSGVLPSYIADQLEREVGVTRRRARFIARDQSAKINGEIKKQRQIDSGFEYFQWVDVHDSRVRHRHRVIANQMTPYGRGIYRWDDLPLSSDGEPIQPGSDYNCRCVARPIRNSVVKNNIKLGKIKPD